MVRSTSTHGAPPSTRAPARPWHLAMVGLLALLLAIGATLSAAHPVFGANGPVVMTATKAGPITLPGGGTVIARLPLPSGGWFVTAKAVVVGVGAAGTAQLVTCVLSVGRRFDLMHVAPVGDRQDGSTVPILLTLAGRLAAAGSATLQCGAEGPGKTRIGDIRLTALRAGALSTREAVSVAKAMSVAKTVSVAKTTGTGPPRVISARMNIGTGAAVPGDGADHPVGRLSLPAGRWWVLAKAVASGGDMSQDYGCLLEVEADYDMIQFPRLSATAGGSLTPLALQVVHDLAAPGHATLSCRGPLSYTIGFVAITAVEAGKLANRGLGGGPTWTVGSGVPIIISGWDDGPVEVSVGTMWTVVAAMALPAGRWTVVSKLWFAADGLPNGPPMSLECRSVFGGSADRSDIVYANNVTRIAPLVLSVAGRSTGPSLLTLQCRRTTSGGTGVVQFVKMTALKAGSLIQLDL